MTQTNTSQSEMMQAVILHGKEDARLETVPVPLVSEGEVRVRIDTALTCGTDVKVYRRGYHAMMLTPPIRFGHEFAGTVEKVGEGVTEWKVGQRVVSANSAPCGDCFYCVRNLPELCEDLLFLNGAYAGAITVPARIVQKNLYAVPENLPLSSAAFTEPLACVVRGMEEMPVQRGEMVIVLGAGPIGLCFVRLCARAGAKVLLVGRRKERLALGAELGAEEVFDAQKIADSEIVALLKSRTEGGRGADKVIEAVGQPAQWETAIALGRKAATISLFGGCPSGTSIRVDTHRLHYEETTLKGTFHHTPSAFHHALQLISSGQVPAEKFISAHAPLSELPSLLADLAQGKSNAIKYAIHPNA